MKKTPIIMLVAIAALLIASYIISYNNQTLNLDNVGGVSKSK